MAWSPLMIAGAAVGTIAVIGIGVALMSNRSTEALPPPTRQSDDGGTSDYARAGQFLGGLLPGAVRAVQGAVGGSGSSDKARQNADRAAAGYDDAIGGDHNYLDPAKNPSAGTPGAGAAAGGRTGDIER